MVYLDYSATTPVLPEVLESYIKVSKEYMGNPNSLHSLGTKSKELMCSAIKQIANILKINVGDIVLTSGATEANNMALIGAALYKEKAGTRIIVSKLEHDSIYNICNYLSSKGIIIDYVKNDEDGLIDFDHLKSLITPNTVLVSIAAVNSEVGIRQPLKTIKQIITRENPATLLHSDMTQAIGKVQMCLSDVDLASMSAHKLYGPKGIGLLYKKEGVKINPLLHGPAGELRPGTSPVPLITSFAKALRISHEDLYEKEVRINALNLQVCEQLAKYPNVQINKTKFSIPHILNISVTGIKAESFIHAMAEKGVFVGSNTACSSGKPSSAVLAIYQDKQRAASTIRISISYLTTKEEINIFLRAFDSVYQKLQELNS